MQMIPQKNDFYIFPDGSAGVYDGESVRTADGECRGPEDGAYLLRYVQDGVTISETDPEEDGVIFPEMAVGNCGLVVCLIQQALKCRAYNCDVDGVFGAQTHAALREFMRDNYLTGDTVANAQVYKLLFADN